MKLNLKPVVVAVAAVLGASQASAATAIGDNLSFSGFGTSGFTVTDTGHEAEYIRDGQPDGATRSGSFNVDSNIGFQLNATATDWLSATVQLLTQQRAEENMTTEVEWAFVKARLIDGLDLRVGRTALPMFTISDMRNVGYANTWVRPPNEVYGLALLHRLEGGDLTYRLPLGVSSLTVSVLGGSSSMLAGAGEMDVKDVRGAYAAWELDGLTVRVGRVQGNVQLSGSEDKYTFSDVGLIYDRNNIVAQAEYVTRRSEGYAAAVNADGWYVLGGYRINSFLPYLSYAHTKPEHPENAMLLSQEQSTIALGVRWDAFKSAAIKFQVENVDTNDTLGISFVTPTVGSGMTAVSAPVDGSVTVATISVDFVF